jgi:hypothetical protein
MSIGVPIGPEGKYLFPDDVWGERMVDMIGTESEREHYHFGCPGKDIADVEAYVRILKRYLDSQTEKGPVA